MIKNSPSSVFLLVDKNGGILYSSAELSSLSNRKNVNELARLNFKPNLNNLLKTFLAVSENSEAVSYSSLNLDSNKKYKAVFKNITGDANFSLIELMCETNSVLPFEYELLKSTPLNDEMFLIITDDAGTIKLSSSAADEFLTDGKGTLSGKKLYGILSKFIKSADGKKIKSALYDKKPFEFLIASGDNGNHIKLKLIPVIDKTHNADLFLMLGINVTDIMQEKLAFERMEKLTKAIMDNIPGMVAILKDKDDAVVLGDANSSFIKTFGLNKRLVINRDINTLFDSGFLQILQQSLKNVRPKGTAYFEVSLNDKSGVKHYGGKTVILKNLINTGNFYILTLRDVTDILKYEKQLRESYSRQSYLSKLKTSFLINMASEIRTPYNSVMAYSNLIEEYLEEGDYDSIKELLDSTKSVLKRVLTLFNNVTEVANIESGEVEIKKDILNGNEVVRLVYQKMAEEVEQKNLDFELKLSDEDLIIEADWVKLEKVILILLDNAIKYSSKGRIILKTKKKNGRAEIIIFDTGKGISSEQINNILEPFNVQEDDVGLTEGAGLGLTIAYKLTKLMGGEFYIHSRQGRWTKITLAFPVLNKQV